MAELFRKGQFAVTKILSTYQRTPFAIFLRDESGATAIEYGLIAALISVAIIGAATTMGTKLSSTFTKVSSQLK